MLRIGVTGHRAYDDEAATLAAIDEVLDRLVPTGDTEVEVVSALAEGADRVVAQRAMDRHGARLSALLPLAPDDYRADFHAPGSEAAFAALLDAAAEATVVPPQPSRVHAYEAAGLAMVDASDVVIAVWDGAPARGRGGVAEVVQYALDQEVPVEVVLVRRTAES